MQPNEQPVTPPAANPDPMSTAAPAPIEAATPAAADTPAPDMTAAPATPEAPQASAMPSQAPASAIKDSKKPIIIAAAVGLAVVVLLYLFVM